MIRLMSLNIVVAPLGASQCVYVRSVLEFDAADILESSAGKGSALTVSQVYDRLRRGDDVMLSDFSIATYESEMESMLLAESSLRIVEVAPAEWCLSMP